MDKRTKIQHARADGEFRQKETIKESVGNTGGKK